MRTRREDITADYLKYTADVSQKSSKRRGKNQEILNAIRKQPPSKFSNKWEGNEQELKERWGVKDIQGFGLSYQMSDVLDEDRKHWKLGKAN